MFACWKGTHGLFSKRRQAAHASSGCVGDRHLPKICQWWRKIVLILWRGWIGTCHRKGNMKNPAQPTTMKYLLALDQGTTSSRSIIFDPQGKVIAVAQKEFSLAGWSMMRRRSGKHSSRRPGKC
jgi:hypothetical protein